MMMIKLVAAALLAAPVVALAAPIDTSDVGYCQALANRYVR